MPNANKSDTFGVIVPLTKTKLLAVVLFVLALRTFFVFSGGLDHLFEFDSFFGREKIPRSEDFRCMMSFACAKFHVFILSKTKNVINHTGTLKMTETLRMTEIRKLLFQTLKKNNSLFSCNPVRCGKEPFCWDSILNSKSNIVFLRAINAVTLWGSCKRWKEKKSSCSSEVFLFPERQNACTDRALRRSLHFGCRSSR